MLNLNCTFKNSLITATHILRALPSMLHIFRFPLSCCCFLSVLDQSKPKLIRETENSKATAAEKLPLLVVENVSEWELTSSPRDSNRSPTFITKDGTPVTSSLSWKSFRNLWNISKLVASSDSLHNVCYPFVPPVCENHGCPFWATTVCYQYFRFRLLPVTPAGTSTNRDLWTFPDTHNDSNVT